MKQLFTFVAISSIFYSSFALGQGICNPDGNVILFCNYDGGTLNINIDEDIPDIRIGLCSYEPLTVNFSGTYAGNVTQVLWAGYTIDGTSVSGVDAGIVDLLQYPAATVQDPDGNQFIICAYECDLDYVPGGCNTVDQATDYFLTTLDGFLRFSQFQYGVWSGSYNISEGGNCCVGTECSIDITANNDLVVCEGDTILLSASGADTYSWLLDEDEIPCDEPCNEVLVIAASDVSYTVTGTDTEGCFGTEQINITVNESPDVDLVLNGGSLYVYGGSEYAWYQDGVLISGASGGVITPEENGVYSVFATDVNGCSAWSNEVEVLLDDVIDPFIESLIFYPNPTKDNLTILGLTEGFYTFTFENNLGQIVLLFNQFYTSEKLLDISEIPNGLYHMRIAGIQGAFFQARLLKQ
jgi:Secretion system C-terminal sorting domain